MKFLALVLVLAFVVNHWVEDLSSSFSLDFQINQCIFQKAREFSLALSAWLVEPKELRFPGIPNLVFLALSCSVWYRACLSCDFPPVVNTCALPGLNIIVLSLSNYFMQTHKWHRNTCSNDDNTQTQKLHPSHEAEQCLIVPMLGIF